jgi:pimeloyl-ACP methyl ester carboxylesterase
MKRKDTQLNGRKISYLDNERAGRALICLHGHFGCGALFSFMEEVFDGRLILLDQRGHGYSDRGDSYQTADYVTDLRLLCEREQIDRPVLLGHSLGGVVAYHYAADTGNAQRLIVEDIGTEVAASNEFILGFPREFRSLYEVQAAFEQAGMRFSQYFIESIRYDGTHWKFQFNYDDMVASQQAMNGQHWVPWEKVACPILLMHGRQSWACTTSNMQDMARRNKHTRLLIYDDAAHSVHDDQRERFCSDVKAFLNE